MTLEEGGKALTGKIAAGIKGDGRLSLLRRVRNGCAADRLLR